MKKLYELSKLVRSKNAGPFTVTLDVIFPDKDTYDLVLATGVLETDKIASLYHLPTEAMSRHCLPLANAVKFSYSRQYPSGDFMDTDLYGCQFHAPLVMLDVPVD